MQIGNIVSVTISLSTAQVTGLAFGRANILSYDGVLDVGTATIYQTSEWQEAMIDDGFLTSDDTYKAVAAMMAQPNPPADVMVSGVNTSVSQVATITPTYINNTTYTVTLNGVVYTYSTTTGGSATTIVTGLKAAMSALTNVVLTGTATLIITAAVKGVAFTVTVGANLALVATTANIGPVPQLIALLAAGYGDWYVLLSSEPTDADILQIAAWIEGLSTNRLFIAETGSVACYDSGSTTDVMYLVKALAYIHTAVMFNVANDDGTMGAAWVGYNLAGTPGATNWAFSQLVGQLPDDLTDAQTTAILAKNGSYFVLVSNVNITFQGKVGSGSYVDVTLFLDWFAGAVQVAVYQLFVDQAARQKKVEFDDGGITQVCTEINAIAKQAILVGGFSAFNLVQPLASSFSASQRQTRNLPSLPFTAQLGGALDSVAVQGTVTF